ncbi:MAG: HD domain-containing protein [Bacteroidetes bacterium]|nr:HD domain-containing protein [Bacteroidota bacterium]
MSKQQDKIITDPVHGFIAVPRPRLLELIQTDEVQRLRRIRQLGVGHYVYPGAEHSRFGHALGAMALMRDALDSLREKGTPIDANEYEAALAAALLHDIGHGPYSHTLEHALISGLQHEAMSRSLIVRLRDRFEMPLDLTLKMFDDTYERPFFHRLISSQLDMDRLDYLRRDSFYTGVAEGKIGVPRIIQSLRVHGPNEELVVEEKGIYAVESFLISRRLMYWQVYLHKTVIAGDQLLRSILARARRLIADSRSDASGMSNVLEFFLSSGGGNDGSLTAEQVDNYSRLDDTDVLYSIKRWSRSTDPVLADLSRRFLNRDFLRVTFLDAPATELELSAMSGAVADWLGRELSLTAAESRELVPYYLTSGLSQHSAYRTQHQSIRVLSRTGRVRELSEIADSPSVSALSEFEEKPYVCMPRIERN